MSRVLELGPLARVELVRQTQAGLNQPLEVEMPREEAQRLGLANGEAVRLVPERVRVFPVGQETGAA